MSTNTEEPMSQPESASVDDKGPVTREEFRQLKAELEQVREEKTELEQKVEELEVKVQIRHEKKLESISQILFGEALTPTDEEEAFAREHEGIVPFIVEDLPHQSSTEADDLRQQLRKEQDRRGQDLARMRRRLNHLADEVDIDISDQAVTGEDKITQLIKNGPDAVMTHPQERSTLERAREMLLHAGDIGSAANDEFGERITFRNPDVKEFLEMKREENLQSRQVTAVFEKLESLARDSPRKVSAGKAKDGVNKLVIYLNQKDLDR